MPPEFVMPLAFIGSVMAFGGAMLHVDSIGVSGRGEMLGVLLSVSGIGLVWLGLALLAARAAG